MVYHLDGYRFLISKPTVDCQWWEWSAKEGSQAGKQQSTVDQGHLAPLPLCWAVRSCWTQPPEHFLLDDTEEETSSNCLVIVKMEGPLGYYGQEQVPESCYLTLSLPTFSTGLRNFFPSHGFLFTPAMRSQFWVYIIRVWQPFRNNSNSNFTSITS
jgi:hypothetical protein